MKSFILLNLVLWAAVNCASLNLGRILGGREAAVGEAPYIVQFRADKAFCAGAIISPTWVLTAAHCLTPFNRFMVFAGMHAVNATNAPEVQYRQVRSSKQYVVHNRFEDGVFDSVDLGLLYIDPPFNLEKSARVKKIAMATTQYEESTPGKFYGWGRKEGGARAKNLRVLDVNFVSYERCWDYFPTTSPLMIYNVCTEGPPGACHGDSGGPLIHETPDGVELVGIASYRGASCNRNTTPNPTVYMNVAMFPQWIANTTRDFVVPS